MKIIKILAIGFCIIHSVVITALITNSSKAFINVLENKGLMLPFFTQHFVNNSSFYAMLPITMGIIAALTATICQKVIKNESSKTVIVILAVLISTSTTLWSLGSYVIAFTLPLLKTLDI